MTEAAAAFWQAYLRGLPAKHPHLSAKPDVFAFGDTPALADELGELVRNGRKRATTSLPAEFTSLGQPLPREGDLGIVTLGNGAPAAVIELIEVRHVAFQSVDADFAADEGEGDATLAWWRDAHLNYFGRVAAKAGASFDETSTVICQRFRVLWPPKG